MKKIFIFLLLFFISSTCFAKDNTFDFSIILSPSTDDIYSIMSLDKDSDIINVIEDYNFSNFEINIYNYIINLLNNNFQELALNSKFMKEKTSNLLINNNVEMNKKIESALNEYSKSLNSQELEILEENKIKKIEINEVYPTFKTNNFSLINSILIKSEDSIIIQSLLNNLQSDGIILISIDKISSYNKLKIEYISNNDKHIIYNKIIEDNLINNLEKDLLLSFLNFFNDTYSIINLQNSFNILSLSLITDISKQRLEKTDNFDEVKIRVNDLKTLNLKNDYLLLKKGIHYLQLQTLESTEIIKLDLNDNIYDLNYESKNIKLDKINITSKMGNLDYYINGKYIDNCSSTYIKEIELPIYIEASKEGYIPSLIQINEEINNLDITLDPIWKGDVNNLEKVQDEFYSSLLSYVLLSFTTLSINNINDAIGNSNFDSAIEVLSTSITIYSSINIANKLISYIKLAIK